MRSILPGKHLDKTLAIFLILTLTACGGDSGNPDNGNPSNPTPNPTPTTTPAPGVNQNPVANAGDDLFTLSSSNVTLDGSNSTDPDGEIAEFQWTQQSGDALTLTGADTVNVQFTAPQVTVETLYEFQLTVTDDEGATASDTVTVTVTPPISSGESGLEARPQNDTCLAGDRPSSDTDIQVERVFPSLSFDSPVALLQAPDDNSRWFVVEQEGVIRVFDNTNNASSSSIFIDIQNRVDDSANESGLLAMAFHPDFSSNGQVFLFYQVPDTSNNCCASQLVRYTSDDGGLTLNPDSAQVLISFTDPYENHFGGQLGFDTEGFLYLSIGDGGSGGDPGNRAQTTSNPWGSVLRIDVDSGSPYSIPSDNPFADETQLCNTDPAIENREENANCPEIYAWGLRNPWRWSFDRATGDLWLADVGQGDWEEVNIVQRGGNYGWRIREGAHCYRPTSGCETNGLIDPVAEIEQPEFQSITGGYVYRGSNIPSLMGKYVFGDYITGPIYALSDNGSGGWQIERLISDSGFNVASFAEDQLGELYVVSYQGALYQIIEGGSSTAEGVPQLLSATGCVNPEDPAQPAEGLIPYDINAPFWSDGAEKARWMALPDDQQIDINSQQDWAFPVGSVLMKSFWLNDRLIETRLFKHHNDGSWAGYTYAWNEDGTDAELVEGGSVVNIDGQDWIYPSGSQCLECHTEAAGRALGPETVQLNKELSYPQTGISANQLVTLEAVGILEELPPDIALVNPYDTDSPLEARARAYLHTNCSQCHRPGGTSNTNLDLRYSTALGSMNICNVDVVNPDMGIENARRLVPGESEQSMLLARMNLRDDSLQMPPIGSNIIDTEGVALIRDWINSLPADACQ